MRIIKQILPRAAGIFLTFTVLCGVVYTGAVTGLAQLLFPEKANGSVFTVEGETYSALLGQPFDGETHMWGRMMNVDTATYTDETGKPLLYAAPSNLSPAGEVFDALVAQRVNELQAAHPEQAQRAIPVDLVTCSGSGLDPHISPAAADYQVGRLARANGLSEDAVREIIRACTKGRLLGVFGEPVVNVLEVNLMLDGILKP